ncbi:MAG: type II toxin-antitoxin system HicB family antitoxin [Thermoplasmata archaeon]
MPARPFHLVIEVDEDGNLISSVPELLGWHSQAKSIGELERRTDVAIADYFGSTRAPHPRHAFLDVPTNFD